MSVSIDAAWLADLKRVFPVVIDPTFSGGTATSTTTTDDTYVTSDNQNSLIVSSGPNQGQYYYALHFLREGNETGAGTARPLIPFADMNYYNPPSGWSWTVTSTAQLHLYSTAFATCDLPTDVNVIETPWAPQSATWSYMQSNMQFSAVVPDGTQNTTTGVYQWTTFNVTNAIGAKYAGFPWYGLELQPDPEHKSTPDCAYDWGSADWNRPNGHALSHGQLHLHSVPAPSIGFTDVGNQWAQPPLKDPVNVVTGGLKDSFTDIPSAAGVYGLDRSRTYNLYDAEQNVSAGGLGRGWSSSFFATIAATTDGTGDVTKLALRTASDMDAKLVRRIQPAVPICRRPVGGERRLPRDLQRRLLLGLRRARPARRDDIVERAAAGRPDVEHVEPACVRHDQHDRAEPCNARRVELPIRDERTDQLRDAFAGFRRRPQSSL